jgi:hypothetical protein
MSLLPAAMKLADDIQPLGPPIRRQPESKPDGAVCDQIMASVLTLIKINNGLDGMLAKSNPSRLLKAKAVEDFRKDYLVEARITYAKATAERSVFAQVCEETSQSILSSIQESGEVSGEDYSRTKTADPTTPKAHMKFELTNPTTVKLKHVNARKENHGEAKVLAMDLRLCWTTNNRALDAMFPGLRQSLFAALPIGELEDDELSGYTLRMEFGLGGEKSDTVVKVCVVKGFSVSPIEGGSVEIEFSVSSSADITGEVSGRFNDFIQQDIVITLLAPTVLATDLIDASAGSGAPGTGPADEPEKPKKAKSKAVIDATEAFIQRNTDADGAALPH